MSPMRGMHSRAYLIMLVACVDCAASCWAARAFLDGEPGTPTLIDTVVIGDFDDESAQGWSASPDFSGGANDFFFTQEGAENFGLANDSSSALSDDSSNPFIQLNLASSTLDDVPTQFVLGDLPGQFNVIFFSLRFDTLPLAVTNGEAGAELIVGEQFFGGAATPDAQAVYFDNPEGASPAHPFARRIDFGTASGNLGDGNLHDVFIQYLPGDTGFGQVFDSVRIDPIGDDPTSAGTLFTIDNITLGRSNSGILGDLDHDSHHTGIDFLLWQISDGTPSTLAAWQAGYGASMGATLATNAVPEPSTLLVGCLALITSVSAARHYLPD